MSVLDFTLFATFRESEFRPSDVGAAFSLQPQVSWWLWTGRKLPGGTTQAPASRVINLIVHVNLPKS